MPDPTPMGPLDGVQTPAYVYELDEVRRSYGRLVASLPEAAAVFYSLKANPHPDILDTLCELGAEAEVCSPGELQAALSAGFRASEIQYTGPGKRRQDLDVALALGVRHFSVDSVEGVAQLEAAAAEHRTPVRTILRINDSAPSREQGLTMTGVASQFGADADWVMAEPHRFTGGEWAPVHGLHLYMGSNIDSEDALMAQFTSAVTTAGAICARLGLELEVLNLGGGFGAPFARTGDLPEFPTLGRRLGELLDAEIPGWRAGAPTVVFETGRYLTSTCGRLLARVLDVKRSHGKHVLVLESGINHLGGMSGLRRLPQIAPSLVSEPDAEMVGDVLVTGPLCTPLDTWGRGVSVPAARIGDVLTVPNVGAYGLYASLVGFLGHPMPLEVVMDGGRITSISRLVLSRVRERELEPIPDPITQP